MFENLIYKYQKRNSNKNLKAEIRDLKKSFNDLREETMGSNSFGYYTFSVLGQTNTVPHKDDSLATQVKDIRDHLGLTYEQAKLAPKPVEKKK